VNDIVKKKQSCNNKGMKLFEPLTLKFEDANWARDPELGLIDTILEQNPALIKMLEKDITQGKDDSPLGRQDTPSVEQVVRAAIYKEMKNLDYRELEYAQEDSRICEQFVKINPYRPYSFQAWQKYISRISAEKLERFMVAINRIGIEEGLEDIQKFRQDSTVVETNIHYPTNNSLVWDCIKESERLLKHLKEEIKSLDFEEYRVKAKKTYFQINVEKGEAERVKLFKKQLKLFMGSINQVSNMIKKKFEYEVSVKAKKVIEALESLHPVMEQVYEMTERHEILKEKVLVQEKVFSIYERHTDIIVKGSREVQFGHKVNLGSGKSNMILTCDIVCGNPKDSDLYQGAIEKLKNEYGIVPESSAADGGYASKENLRYALEAKISNIVFGKVRGSMENIVKNKWVETRLKKWRSGIEAVISNLKRGFQIGRCAWKGLAHYRQKIFWSVIGYNIRVMINRMLETMTL
jgi:IS5 family transposase